MANILYITADFYIKSRMAGGMGTKTKALQTAWGLEHNIEIASDLDEMLAELYDVVIIELLGLRNNKQLSEKVKKLKRCPAPKIVYGSDSEIFRWTGNELNALKEVVTLWIPNCPWQQRYFMDFDLPVSAVVYEPIDTDIFRPGDISEKIIIAGGAINYEKQSEFFVELFSKIREMDTGEYRTAYLGSAGLWGDLYALNMELQMSLEKVTDHFYGAVSQNKVSKVLSTSAIGVLNPKYETCNRFDMELMGCGKPRICGPHVCYDDRPTTKRFVTMDECISALQDMTQGFTELPNVQHGVPAREFAVDNFSYEASMSALNYILRSLM